MIARLFKRRAERSAPAAPPGSRAYAIGDVHGRLDLMTDLLARIEADDAARPPAKTYIVLLGDLVDRGPDSRGVIAHLVAHPPAFGRLIALRGNHEEFFEAVLGGEARSVPRWLTYGGYECAESYGVTRAWTRGRAPDEIARRLTAAVPDSHKAFLEAMGDSFRFGDYLFVHAGVRPGVPIAEQTSQDLRWIREGFLDDDSDHGVTVVHGHTIVERPEEKRNRIGIDTGAYRTGRLTALALEGRERWYLTAEDKQG